MSDIKKYIFANKSYGLYYGEMTSYDPVTGVAVVANCRHVCRWHGRKGGITALAEHGVCGPRVAESRIAGPSPRATLTGVVNVFECTATAATAIDSFGHE